MKWSHEKGIDSEGCEHKKAMFSRRGKGIAESGPGLSKEKED